MGVSSTEGGSTDDELFKSLCISLVGGVCLSVGVVSGLPLAGGSTEEDH